MKKNNFKIIQLKSKRNKNTIKRTVLIKDFIINEIIGIHKNEKVNKQITFLILAIVLYRVTLLFLLGLLKIFE